MFISFHGCACRVFLLKVFVRVKVGVVCGGLKVRKACPCFCMLYILSKVCVPILISGMVRHVSGGCLGVLVKLWGYVVGMCLISCVKVRYKVRCCGSTFYQILSTIPKLSISMLSGCTNRGSNEPFFLRRCGKGELHGVYYLLQGCLVLFYFILQGGGTYFICLTCNGSVSLPFVCVISLTGGDVVSVRRTVTRGTSSGTKLGQYFQGMCSRQFTAIVIRSRQAGSLLRRCNCQNGQLFMPRFGCYFSGGCSVHHLKTSVISTVTRSGIGVLFFKGVACSGKVSVLVSTIGDLRPRLHYGTGMVVTKGSFSKAMRQIRPSSGTTFGVILERVRSSRLMCLCRRASCITLPCHGASRDKVLRVTFCFHGPVLTDSIPCFEEVLARFPDFNVLSNGSIPTCTRALTSIVKLRSSTSCFASGSCFQCAGQDRVRTFGGRFTV